MVPNVTSSLPSESRVTAEPDEADEEPLAIRLGVQAHADELPSRTHATTATTRSSTSSRAAACAMARCASELVPDRLSVLAMIRARAINAGVRRHHDGLEAAHRSTVPRLDLVSHRFQLFADQFEQL